MHYLNTLSALLCLHPSPAGGDAEGVHYADQPSAARHILVTIASHPPLTMVPCYSVLSPETPDTPVLDIYWD